MLKIRIWSFRNILYFLIFLSLLMSFLYRVFLIFFFKFFFFTFFWLDQRPTLIGESDHFLIKGFILFFRWRACKYSFDFQQFACIGSYIYMFRKKIIVIRHSGKHFLQYKQYVWQYDQIIYLIKWGKIMVEKYLTHFSYFPCVLDNVSQDAKNTFWIFNYTTTRFGGFFGFCFCQLCQF